MCTCATRCHPLLGPTSGLVGFHTCFISGPVRKKRNNCRLTLIPVQYISLSRVSVLLLCAGKKPWSVEDGDPFDKHCRIMTSNAQNSRRFQWTLPLIQSLRAGHTVRKSKNVVQLHNVWMPACPGSNAKKHISSRIKARSKQLLSCWVSNRSIWFCTCKVSNSEWFWMVWSIRLPLHF